VFANEIHVFLKFEIPPGKLKSPKGTRREAIFLCACDLNILRNFLPAEVFIACVRRCPSNPGSMAEI
jgi:hypothetical protein